MGEIADMMLEGLLDEETGEYIGDRNLEKYGSESPGFPVSYERQAREEKNKPNKAKQNTRPEVCPECGKRLRRFGLATHISDCHNPTFQKIIANWDKIKEEV